MVTRSVPQISAWHSWDRPSANTTIGPQSDVAKFFSTQWHTIRSSVQDMAELEARLKDIEQLAQSLPLHLGNAKRKISAQCSRQSFIDAVVISHEFTDHCNKHTLLELDPDTPIFATKLAFDLIRSWDYFSQVQEMPTFSAENLDWRKTSFQPLPKWLGISRVVTVSDALYYHSAILLTFDLDYKMIDVPSEEVRPAEAVIYSPHGIHAQGLRHLNCAVPAVNTLALLHGLHDIRISLKQLNLGAHNGLKAQKICKAKYWVSTHDEVKKETGFITAFLHRKALTLQEALNEEMKTKGKVADESELAQMKEVTFANLESGESLLLA